MQSRMVAAPLANIDRGYEHFNETLASHSELGSETIGQVRAAVGRVDRSLAAIQQSRNLKRLQYLLDRLELCGKAIDCAGYEAVYLPVLWGPVRFCVEAASKDIHALENLLTAYDTLAKSLPNFQTLQEQPHTDFILHIVSLTYADILEFHSHTCLLFQPYGWKVLFPASWARFSRRTYDIFSRLRTLATALTSGENVNTFSQVSLSHARSCQEARASEEKLIEAQTLSVISWLNNDDHQLLENRFNRKSRELIPGTTTWFLRHRLVREWLSRQVYSKNIWIHGKPGSGKSVLCAQLIEYAASDPAATVLFYLCDFSDTNVNSYSSFLKSMITQLISKDSTINSLLYDKYVIKNAAPSDDRLKKLLLSLMRAFQNVRIIIDGVDECTLENIKSVLNFANSCTNQLAGDQCKVAIFSRDIRTIRNNLRKSNKLDLNQQKIDIDRAIGILVHHKINLLRTERTELNAPEAEFEQLEAAIVTKSNGMFLWVHLVIQDLADADSIHELWTAVDSLPVGLNETYERCLIRMTYQLGVSKQQLLKSIVSWTAFSERPLRLHELAAAVAYSIHPYYLDSRTRLSPVFIETAKPLVQVDASGAVSFVHFTVKEYLTKAASPFAVTAFESLCTMCKACISYLTASINLADKQGRGDERTRSICQGLHDLHNYSREHTFTHLEQLIRESSLSEAPIPQDLSSMLSNWGKQHASHLWKFKQRQIEPFLGQPEMHPFSTVSQDPLFLALCDAISSFDQDLKRAQASEGEGEGVTDQTLYSEITATYNSTVEHLIDTRNDQALMYIDAVTLSGFRSSHSHSSFTCPFVGCAHRFSGFETPTQRNRHEQTHSKRLWCDNAGCKYPLSFASAKDLKAHIRRHHPKNEMQRPTLRLPRSPQDKASHDDVVRPTPPPPSSDQQIAPDFQYTPAQLEQIGNQLSELELDKLPPHLKRQGDDWHAVFNARVHRRLNVDLVHDLSHQSVVCCVCFSQDGRFVASGCNFNAQIFDASTGKQVCHLQHHETTQDGDLYIRSVCFSPDGKYLATGSEDKIIRVWDLTTKQIWRSFAGHDQDIYSLDFARDGRYMASGSGDRTIRLWDIREHECVLTLQIEDGVNTVAISPNSRLVAAASLDKSVRIWDTQTGFLVERTEGGQMHKDSAHTIAFSPTGSHLVSGSLDKTIRMWKLDNTLYRGVPKSSKCVRTFEGHKDFVLSVALTPDGSWIMSGSKDRGVQFWDPTTGDAQLMLQGHKNSVISVAPSPQGYLFATGSGDMHARIWQYTPYSGP